MLSAVRKQGVSCDLLIPVIVTLEALIVFLAGISSAHSVTGDMLVSSIRDVVVLGSLLGTVLVVACLKSAETYTPRSLAMPSHWPLRVVSIGACACLATGLVMTMLNVGLDWSWALVWSLYAALALAFSRMVLVPAFKSWVPSEGFDRLVAVVGTSSDAGDDLNGLDRDLSARFDRNCTCRIYSRPDDLQSAEGERWIERLHSDGVEEVVILPSLHDNREWIHEAIRSLEVLPVRVSLAIPRPALDSNQPGYVYAALIDQPLSAAEQAVKRVFDAVTSLLLLVFLAPLMLLTAALIRLESSGPVFFKQQRYGFGKKIIEVYKFRSMYHDMSDQLADRLTERDDPRVTRVGAFIRRFSIDELPQLFNVLRGEMSMVGPRPNPLNAKAGGELYDRVVDNFYTRYRVLPGITGWAQINGLRGNTDTKEKLVRRVEYDLYYIRHWSFWLDLKIVLLTPLASLEGENAF
ncbi:MAG: exopolysaccharide biosynthesis polyprenyl glycosylphosphotransferase [Geminicoccaceae bacterium]